MLADIRVGLRLAFGFGIVIVLFVGTAVMGVARMSALNDSASLVSTDLYPKTVHFNNLIHKLDSLQVAMRGALIQEDPTLIKAELDAARRLHRESGAGLEAITKILSPKGRQINAILIAKHAAYGKSLEVFGHFIETGSKPDALALLNGKLGKDLGAYETDLRKMTQLGSTFMEKNSADIDTQYRSSARIMAALTLLAILLAAAFGFWLTGSITRPLNRAVAIAQTVSDGDLSSHIEASAKDETGMLIAALKQMNGNLAHVVGKVRASAQTIDVAVAEMAAGYLELSGRTEQQAASLEETAAAVEQLTVTVRHNADNASQAQQLAMAASAAAMEGETVADQVIDTMRDIETASREIVDIISVIDGIAFQTNILALNAAVEAARAGEQGRGFAVVAAEVRGLAQRSAGAAKEIKQLITSSVEKVAAGTRQVHQAGATMTTLKASVGQVEGIIAEISEASRGQSIGIAEINRSIAQIDQGTQQNAALVEEAAASAQLLQGQTAELTGVVGSFKLAHSAISN